MPHADPTARRQYLRDWTERNREHIRSQQRDYRKRNKARIAKVKKTWARTTNAAHRRTLKAYGMTVADYDAMLARQGGRCAICRRPPGKRRLAVDHDHRTGRNRALLCGSCNLLIGYARENLRVLWAAIEYLHRHGAHR